MREMLLAKTIELLKKKGFAVESFLHSNSCFDIAAKRHGLTFAIKVLENIDSLREEQCLELRKVSGLFNAIALVIGEKTKAFRLKENEVYERYGVNALNYTGFENLLEENFPSVRYFKGKQIVEIDSEKLRKMRKEKELTLEELAEKIGTTTESVYRYEKGAKMSLQKAEELEKVLGIPLVKKIDLLEEAKSTEHFFEDALEDPALEKIHDLGVDLATFKHAPFSASTTKKQALLIGKGTSKQMIKKKAIELTQAKHVFASGPMIVTREFKAKTIAHVPIIEEEELKSMSKFKDLKELIKERSKEK